MASGKHALLVGCSFCSVPMLFALKRLGFTVSVCGRVQHDPAHNHADQSFFIDYSKPDQFHPLVEQGGFDFLVPTTNDRSYMACVEMGGQRALPGFDTLETALTLHTKAGFRALIAELDLPAPGYVSVAPGEVPDVSALRFPVLVKPTDSYSGRGMAKVDKAADLPAAIKAAFEHSHSGSQVIIEEFVTGNLYSHSAFISDGKIAADFFVDEYCTTYEYQVNCSHHPSFLSNMIKEGVRAAIAKVVAHLGVADGLFHTQFIASGDEFWLIEVMRRSPGDLYGGLIERSTGFAYIENFVRPFVGLPVKVGANGWKPGGTDKLVARHTIAVDKPVTPASIGHRIPANRVEIVPHKSSGALLERAPFDKMAIVFAEFDDPERMRDVTPKMADYIDITAYN